MAKKSELFDLIETCMMLRLEINLKREFNSFVISLGPKKFVHLPLQSHLEEDSLIKYLRFLKEQAVDEKEEIRKGNSSKRYRCNCKPGMTERERYRKQRLVKLPEWSLEYFRRYQQGIPTTIAIDSCIVRAIEKLWKQKIETVGCCCGHNEQRAWVQVTADDYPKMFELGYEQRPVQVIKGSAQGFYCFYL